MLFDLKGKRRRVVQGTYLTLAVLMGAGLVLFGIGSSVNGGLGDLFKGGGGSNKADESIQKRIDAADKTLKTSPNNEAALVSLTRAHYQLATTKADAQTSEFTADAKPELQQAVGAWERYVKVAEKPDPSLARLVIQAYDGIGRLETNAPEKAKAAWSGAAGAAETAAAAQPSAQNYLVLVQYATLAGQTRKAELAGKKAIQLAPKAQKQQAKQAVEQAKAQAASQGQAGAQAAPPGATP
jgi:hypothetical protein